MDLLHFILITAVVCLLGHALWQRDILIFHKEQAELFRTEVKHSPKFRVGQKVCFWYAGAERVGVVESVEVSKTYKCYFPNGEWAHSVSMDESFVKEM